MSSPPYYTSAAANPDNTVFVTARDPERSTHLAKVAEEAPIKNVHTLRADVVDHQSLEAAAQQVAQATGGSLDVLVHNAAKMDYANGILFHGLTDYENMDALDAEFIEAFKVNTLGAIHCVNAFLPLLRKGASKKIIIISTGGGERDIVWKARITELAAYGVTKCAENMVMTKYATQLEEEGFIVTAISPGNVDVSATSPSPQTVEELADLNRVMSRIRQRLPGYPDKPLSPEVSVRRLLATVDGMTLADNGTYRSVWL